MCLINFDIYVIDRIEENIAICENKKTKEFIDIPLSLLPPNIKEGDILKYINGTYIIDSELTKSAKLNINERFNRLKK